MNMRHSKIEMFRGNYMGRANIELGRQGNGYWDDRAGTTNRSVIRPPQLLFIVSSHEASMR